MPNNDDQRRLVFVSNALTGTELTGGNRDVSMIYTVLTNPHLGACSKMSPAPLHQCESGDKFERALKNLLKAWNIADQLILYFSGHGEILGEQYCLKFGKPEEEDCLPFDNILNDLKSRNVKRAIIILDACFSGEGIKGDGIKESINSQPLPKGIVVLASSQPSQLSHELPDGSSSIFTTLFCEGIESGLKGKKTADGFITIEDIVDFIKEEMESDDRFKKISQRPSYTIKNADRSIWISKNTSGAHSESKVENQPLVTTMEELKVLYDRTKPDHHPCPDASLDDLDWELVENFYTRIYSQTASNLPRDIIVKQLKLYSPIPYKGKECLHRSAVLCFAKRPDLFYPQAKSTFVLGNLGDESLVRTDINGPLSKQVQSLFEKILESLYIISDIGKAGQREEKHEIDKALIRELVSNAIAHRNYEQAGNVTVVLNATSLEIKSPGRFPQNFLWPDILEKNTFGSCPINIAISYYLSHLLVFESVGQGLAVIKKYIEANEPDSVTMSEYPGPITCISILRNKRLKSIAQGNNPVAMGAGGIYVNGAYHFPDPHQAERERSEAARLTYLEKLRRHCQTLPLVTLGSEEGSDDDLTLDQVYVELNTDLTLLKTDLEKLRQGQKIDLHQADRIPQSNEERKNSAFLPTWDAVLATPRVVLLGDPGAGKSTFVRKLIGVQAAVQLGAYPALAGIGAELLPLLVVLREWAPVLRELDLERLPEAQKNETLRAALRTYLDGELRRLNAVDFGPRLWQAVETGQVLLVLDGLDEVPQDLRKRVRQAAGALASFHLERIIITCRIRSYTSETVFANLPVFTLRGFDKEQISHFVQAWYNAQAEKGQVHGEKEERIRDLIAAATSAGLREIVSNPMTLTSMALIHQKEVGLPKQRVRLYQLVVEVLVQRWQKHKQGRLVDFLSDSTRLLPALEHLAYAAHSVGQNQQGASDLLRKDAIEILERPDHLGGPGAAGEFLDYLDQRAGLLKGNGGDLQAPTSYSFLHRIFQEYLAGCYLVRGRSAAREIARHAAQGDAWTLAVQLGAEEMFYNRRSPEGMLDLAYQLCSTPTPTGEPAQRAALWSGLIATVAGIEKIGVDHDSPFGGAAYLERLRTALIHLLASDLPPRERAEAGRVLGRLGDPRIEVMTCEAIEFCYIPAGEFIFGESQKKLILSEFWISKYPITQSQFNQFVQTGGYTQAEYWSEAIQSGFWKESGFKGQGDVEFRTTPRNLDEPFSLPNHPVVDVSWYEALAFTHWFNQKMSNWAKSRTDVPWQDIETGKLGITLPSEEQWEKAACGPAIFLQKPRDYPWGEKFDPNMANTVETGIGTTTAIGCFPKGASSYGVLDLSGNVWEWTTTPYDISSFILRGGSFYDLHSNARCTVRSKNFSDGGSVYPGFRIVISSSSE